jgi:hypothetical protein
MFSAIAYTVEHPVDVKTGCPCERHHGGPPVNTLSHGKRSHGNAAAEVPTTEAVDPVDEPGTAPRRISFPFFGSWTDTRAQ